ncbi:MAG: histidinol dehydrogenase [Pseudomonadota bacterium]
MARIFTTSDEDFDRTFEALLSAKREVSEDVDQAVAAIIRDVQSYGDDALLALTERFDRLSLSVEQLHVSEEEIEQAVSAVPKRTLDALRFAHDRILSHHKRQLPHDQRYQDALGVELGYRWSAIEDVGLYVPGGTASYPSSVLMNAVPAKVAGVERLVMVSPTPGGEANPAVLAAAHIAGVDEIYRVGGAQAVAALAYGTQTIAPVFKIVGPGNAYVAAAKRRVFGQVGIDMIAGPSEVLIIADEENNPDWIAADLLAQAEHDTAAQSILMTDSEGFAEAVSAAVERQLSTLERRDIAEKSWRDFGAILVLTSLDEAPGLANRIAAEHLEIATADPEAIFSEIKNAGAVFLGAHTPEAIGDYVGGSNHVLPTARSARFSSGLSVLDFMKKTTLLKCNAESLRDLADAAVALGEAEGLTGHARSVAIRLNKMA